MGSTLEVMLTIIRSIADMFYIIQIYVRFCTAYVAPSSCVFGRGELVIDYSKIVSRFWIDVIAALPLPQVLIWLVIPNLRGSTMANTKATGIVTKRAWQRAAYNLMLYTLASHVLGASWYLLSIERQEACWISACKLEKGSCQSAFFDCRRVNDPDRNTWFQSTNITNVCDPNSSSYPFGIYSDAIKSNVTSSMFFNNYFYCLWWGLNNLSSLGQNLSTSVNVEEISFAIIIANLGLVLFALLIGNMQTYLQSTTARLEEWRIKRTDTEQWMHHRQLPPELRQAVRKYNQYKWVATRGVDEEALLKDLPLDLRRDIKRHLCLDLVRRVPLFDQMDEKMLDAICERLQPGLSTQGMCLVREGDPVDEMLFIIRGNLDSNVDALDSSVHAALVRVIRLPSSTRTVKAISEVETFALRAEDLKFVASQLRRLHSKKLRHKFRFYSHQWRLWAACFVQVVWRHYRRRKIAAERKAKEYLMPDESELLGGPLELDVALCGSSLAVMKARLAATSRRGVKNLSGLDSSVVSSLKKPEEPDFSWMRYDQISCITPKVGLVV
ncbi:unnamed protein product [Camellia sinensis]